MRLSKNGHPEGRARRISVLLNFLFFLNALGCGYGFSTVRGPLPGGVKKVAIPTFQNRTHEAALENIFTSSLRDEFFKSRLVKVVNRGEAEAEIVGIINSISIEPFAHTEKELDGRSKKVLANEYNARAEVSISLIRLRDGAKLWERNLSDARRYATNEDLLQNEVKQQEAFQKVAVYLMEQAHDLMFEDF